MASQFKYYSNSSFKRRKSFFSVKKFIIVLSVFGVCAYFYFFPLFLVDYFSETFDASHKIASILTERSGVIESISRAGEEDVVSFRRYYSSEIFSEIYYAVDLEKFWQGIKSELSGEYNAKMDITEDEKSRNLKAEIFYKNILFCTLNLYQNIPQAKDYTYEEIPDEPKQIVKNIPKNVSVSTTPTVGEGLASSRISSTQQSTQFPQIAIIIDDVGNNIEGADVFFSLPKEVTPAILPKLQYSAYFSEKAAESGFDIMLHLPLEASNKNLYPGPGTITIDMNDKEILSVLHEDLNTVAGASGVNNHMGSKATADIRVMDIIFKELKDKGLFFIDSYTSNYSVARPLAKENDLFSLKRDVFIDNKSDPEYIRGQMRQLIEIAKRDTFAVGIGHFRLNTLKVLAEMLPDLKAQGVELVRIKDLVNEVNKAQGL